MMKFKVIGARNLVDFERKVNEMIALRWQVIGSMTISRFSEKDDIYAIGMTKNILQKKPLELNAK